jgi:chromosome partitioning protein
VVDVITSTTPGHSAPPQTGDHARNATVIVFGNEKGGTGKSTTAMHVIVGLLREGYRVGAIDLDAPQGTLTRYFDNRRVYAAQQGLQLPQPLYRTVGRSELRDSYDAEEEECERLVRAIEALSNCDFIVLDTPGSDNHLSREGHYNADILVTPLNDSFVDLDLLGRLDLTTHKFLLPGHYSEMVCEQNKRRMQRGKASINWIVMRNRLASLDSRNKRNMDLALAVISQKLGLRLVAGFSERVIFRELFLKGLTLLDIRDQATDVTLTMSHIAALQEVRNVIQAIGVERLDSGVKQP